MTVSDYIIIYLSAGAPVAVFAYLQRASVPLLRRFIDSAAAMLVWPVVAGVWIYHRLADDAETPERAVDRKIQTIRNRFEETIRRGGAAVPIHEWRQTFERYVGLSLAIADPEDNSDVHKLFEVAGGKNGKLGTVCLNRRNRSRLIFHHTEARNDFIDAVIRAGRGRDPLNLAIELATLLDDPHALADLTAMAGRTEQKSGKTPVIDMEQEVWNPPTPNTHIANRI